MLTPLLRDRAMMVCQRHFDNHRRSAARTTRLRCATARTSAAHGVTAERTSASVTLKPGPCRRPSCGNRAEYAGAPVGVRGPGPGRPNSRRRGRAAFASRAGRRGPPKHFLDRRRRRRRVTWAQAPLRTNVAIAENHRSDDWSAITVADSVETLILDLLDWIGSDSRPYTEVMDAWRTSCPRLPVWEEANERGFVSRQHQGTLGTFVAVTPLGMAYLSKHRPQTLTRREV